MNHEIEHSAYVAVASAFAESTVVADVSAIVLVSAALVAVEFADAAASGDVELSQSSALQTGFLMPDCVTSSSSLLQLFLAVLQRDSPLVED